MPTWLAALLRIILHRRTRYVLSWLAAIALTILHYQVSRHVYDVYPSSKPEQDRRDANYGHTLVDFGGQWLMGRIVATGRGRELYLKSTNKEILDSAYPREDGPPNSAAGDADNLLGWMMDAKPQIDPAVNGPLYPPIQAFFFAPFGLFMPRDAYHCAQIAYIAFGWLAGLAAAGITRWRIWWPIATMFLMVFPGYAPAVHLGQNSIATTMIVLVGWWLVTARWELAGGMVWGLLAYKPVWALAFLLVPILTRRWRMLLGMVSVGIGLILATLPIIGIDPWFRWMRIGESAANLYRTDENWIFLSRDLLSIPRRWMLDFKLPHDQRVRPETAWIGFAMWAVIIAITTAIALLRKRTVRMPTGYGAALVALAAWLTCYHFIYYDTMLAALPIFMLLSDPARFIRPTLLVVAPATPAQEAYYAPRWTAHIPALALVRATPWNSVVMNSFVLTVVATLIFIEQTATGLDARATFLVGLNPIGPTTPEIKVNWGQMGTPWDTFVLMALWAYCGLRVLLDRDGSSMEMTRG